MLFKDLDQEPLDKINIYLLRSHLFDLQLRINLIQAEINRRTTILVPTVRRETTTGDSFPSFFRFP